MASRRRSAWQALNKPIRDSIGSAWRAGVPAEATALYGRWWQLETWLRSLAYVELRARDGAGWAAALPVIAEQREKKDRQHEYMMTSDAHSQLAYLDPSPLFQLGLTHWPLFAQTLIDENTWRGRVDELLRIRHRIGHCRRPHTDDLRRVEQTLRDLEPGAFRATSAFNRQFEPSSKLADPVVDAWVRNAHLDAGRLVRHAEEQYDVQFVLRCSHRPWAAQLKNDETITGKEGYLWHAAWYLLDGALDLRRFWGDGYLEQHRDLIVLLCADTPMNVEVSFAAVDNPDTVADAIGNCFDALISSLQRGKIPERVWDSWSELHAGLDPHVQVNTPWSIIDDITVPVTIFGA